MKNNKTNKKKIIIGIIIFAVLVAVILLSMLSCEKEYKVQLKVDGNIYLTQKLHKGDTLKNIDIPTKEGYTFIGWYVDGKEFKIDEPIDENITLEAKFTKNRYTIVIDAGNGSSVLTEEIEYKGKIEKPKTPKRTGYKFIGWYNGDEEFDFDTEVTGNINITAKWEKIKKTNESSKTDDNSVISQKYVVQHFLMDTNGKYPEVPNIEEVKEAKMDTKVTPSVKNIIGFISPTEEEITISKDEVVVKYYYERKQYELKLVGDEGINETNGSGTYYYQALVDVSVTLNNGYEFVKWSNGEKKSTFTYEIGLDNQELSATTKLINYSIAYELNGGKSEKDLKESYDIKTKIDLGTPSKVGYDFKSWKVNGEEIEGTVIEPNNYYEDLKIEAIFEARTDTPYKVELYFMNTKGEYSSATEIMLKEGTTDEIPKYAPENKIGFLEPKLKENGEEIPVPTINGDGTTVLKYYYERKQYTLEINKSIGVDTLTYETKDKYYFEEEISINVTAKDGYHLLSNEDNSKVEEDNFTYKIIDGDNVINVESEGHTFKVNYHNEDGTLSSMESSTFTYGDSYSLSNNTITKDDYTLTIKDYDGKGKDKTVTIKNTFKGWATDTNSKKVVYNENDTLNNFIPEKCNEELNLYPVFESDSYELTVPSQNGYTFKGFKVNGKDIPKEDYNNYLISEDNEEITTEWEIINYNISFDLSGVEGVECTDCNETTYTIEEEKELPVPTKDGYTFNGWVDSKGELIKKVPEGTFGDLNLSLDESSFTANTNTPYKVELYYMDTKGNYPDKADTTIDEYGTTDSQIDYVPVEKDKGFKKSVIKESADGEEIKEVPIIKGDGSTVVKYYYERKQFTLKVTTTVGIKDFTVNDESYDKDETYYYEEKLNIKVNAKDGYHIISDELLESELTNNDKTETFIYTIDDDTNEITLNSAGNTFTVKYHDDKGENEKVEEKTYKEGITLDEIIYEKEPYTLTIKHVVPTDEESKKEIEFNNEFVGWSTNKGSSDITYNEKDSIIPSKDGEEINLYAVFKTEKKTLEKLIDTEDYYFKDFEDSGIDIEERKLTNFTISSDKEITAHWLEVISLEEWDSMVMEAADTSMFNSNVLNESNITGYIKGFTTGYAFSAKLLWLTNQLLALQTNSDYIEKIGLQFGVNGTLIETSVDSKGRVSWDSRLITQTGNFVRNEIDGDEIKIVVYLDNEKVIAKDRDENLDYTIHIKTKTKKANIDSSGTEALGVFNKTKPDLDIESRDKGTITFRYSDPNMTTYDAIFQMGVNTAIHKFFENEFVKNVEVTFDNGKQETYDRSNLSALTLDFNSDISSFDGGNYSYPVYKLYADGNDVQRYKLKVKVNLYVDTDKTMPTEYEILFAPVEKITYTVNYQKNGTGDSKEVTCTVGEECELTDIVNVVTYYNNLNDDDNGPKYLIPDLKTCTIDGQDCMDKIQLKDNKYVIVKDLTTEKNKAITLKLTFDEEKLPYISKTVRGDNYIFGGWSTKNSTDELDSIIGYQLKPNGFVDEYTYAEPGTAHNYDGNTTLYAVWWKKPYIDSISFGLYSNLAATQNGAPSKLSEFKVNEKSKKAFYITIPENEDMLVYVPSLIVKTTSKIKLNPYAKENVPSSDYADLWINSLDGNIHIGDFAVFNHEVGLPFSSEDNITWKAQSDTLFSAAYGLVEETKAFYGKNFYSTLKNGIIVDLFGEEPIPITNGKELGIVDKFGCNGLACTPHYSSMASEHINGKTYIFFATDENMNNMHTITYKIGEETVCTLKVPNDSPIPNIAPIESGYAELDCNGTKYTVTNWGGYNFDNAYATSDITITGQGQKIN